MSVPSRYSTIDEGHCIGDEGTRSDSCAWYATSVKRVSKRCHDASMANYILTRSTHMQEELANCPVPPGTSEVDATVWPFVRPNSMLPADPCWIRTFFAVLLGPDADHQAVVAFEGAIIFTTEDLLDQFHGFLKVRNAKTINQGFSKIWC